MRDTNEKVYADTFFDGGVERKDSEPINPTKKKILKASLRLFSEYGFNGTSTRMIANAAQVNLSAIAFHFKNKENLYNECLNYITHIIGKYYEEDYEKIDRLFKQNEMTKEKAYEYLKDLIRVQIRTSFSKQNAIEKEWVYQDGHSTVGNHELQRVVFERVESVMANLISVLAPVTKDEAIVASRHINGGIIAFSEHEALMEPYLSPVEDGKKNRAWVSEYLLQNSLAIIDRLIHQKSFE